MRPERLRGAAAALVAAFTVAARPQPAWSAAPSPAPRAAVASLVAQVEPDDPWVGQPVLLRIRLVLGRDLAEEPNYVPPVTNGFWAEAASLPQSYASVQDGRRVLITETRARMVPLTPGIAHVGAASADLVFAEDAASPVFRSEAPERRITVWSRPIDVRVRQLPAGAPPGFGGAVGALAVSWSADRAATSQDVPVTVRLDVRGTGNLPLLERPALICPDGEVYAGTTEDSLPQTGTLASGRRRFQWNVLAKRTGTLRIAAPSFAWFDPGSAAYRSADPVPVVVAVGPPLFARFQGGESFPGVFLRDAPDPFARGVAPWWWVLAGLLGGGAVLVVRLRPPPDADASERARVAGWRNALRAAAGPAFWRAAEEVSDWLERRGRGVAEVKASVEATRYGGGEADANAVRARLTKELAAALPAPPARHRTRILPVVLGAITLAILVLTTLRTGESAAPRLGAADRAARGGDLIAARAAWVELWRAGARSPALAARLAWAEAARGALGPAAVWILRGERAGARDPALAWVSDRVREGGGLAGEKPVRLPIRPMEWAVLGLVLGIAAGAAWPRRGLMALLVGAALLVAVAEPIDDWRAARSAQAVINRPVTLEGTEFELAAGQVVRVLGREGAQVKVRAARDLDGRIPAAAVLPVDGSR